MRFSHQSPAYESRPYRLCSTAGPRSDRTILLVTAKSKQGYPKRLHRVSFRDAETGLYLVFLINCFDLPALTISAIYKQRWQIEMFFKWFKQNLLVKHLR